MPDDPSNSNEPMIRIELEYPESTAARMIEIAALAGYSNPAAFVDALIMSSLEQVVMSFDGYEVMMLRDRKAHPYDSPPLTAAFENGQTERQKAKPIPAPRHLLQLVVNNSR